VNLSARSCVGLVCLLAACGSEARAPRARPPEAQTAGVCEPVAPSLIVAVDSGVNLAVDSTGGVNVTFRDDGGNLVHATRTASEWEMTPIAHVGNGGSDIVADPTGGLHIVYYNSDTYSLEHATNVSGTWSAEVVDTGYASSISLGLGPDGSVHLMYFADSMITYASNAGGTWSATPLEHAQYTSCMSLAVDSTGAAHVVFSPGWSDHIRYVTNAGSTWHGTDITDPGGFGDGNGCSLALDGNDAVHISYIQWRQEGRDLWYATNALGQWSNRRIYDGVLLTETSLALDDDGAAYIGYFDFRAGHLGYVTNASGSFASTIVQPGEGKQGVLGLGRYGAIHVAYWDISDATIHYTTLCPEGAE
jgi:hypothetical protein